MRKLLTSICLIVIFGQANAQVNYSADMIPKELLPYASAVVREDDGKVHIISKNEVIYNYHFVITVLNSNGDKYAGLELYHNKSRIIKTIKGVVYNEFGKTTGKFSDSNFEDDNYGNDASLFEEVKFKHYKPEAVNYPYTIEYAYEIHDKQTLNIDPWYAIANENVAVQKSSYTLVCPANFKVNIKEHNYTGKGATGLNQQDFTTYSWQATNLPALREEPFSPVLKSYLTYVEIAPADFAYEGVTGVYNDWKTLGKWIYDKLLVTRTQLPPQATDEMLALTKDVPSPKEKARKIYEYMQNKTRYVSIQIGIGGYQPFPAAEVNELGYSDCKGLVNYTQALLKAANIDSYYCVVKSGSEKNSLEPDFASMGQADHIILCLPFKNDTTFLECTSKTIPFGFLSDFTDDRTVLACTPDGGKLLHTPKYAAIQNTEDKKASFMLSENGELTGVMNTTFSGTQYEYRDGFLREANKDQLKQIKKDYPINNMEIEALSFQPAKTEIPSITESVKLKAVDYAANDNGKLLFLVNATNRSNQQFHESRNRKNPVFISRGFTDDVKITYSVPSGYRSERQLLNVNLHKNFGSYHAEVSINGDQITYTRKFQLLNGTYSKEAYNDLVNFYEAVYDADRYTMALTKNKNP